MAAGGLVRELCEELSCSICLDYFRDPATIAECGHSFCRACLTRSWGEAGAGEASCPQCRGIVKQRNLKPNWQLAKVVEIAKKLQGEREAKGRVCEKHQEPLQLFCRVDRTLICVVCEKSKEHLHHRVIPMEKAAQEYKDKLRGYTESRMKEREKILVCKAKTEKLSQDKLERTESAREKSVANFRKWHHFLEEQEQCLLAQMEDVGKEIARERDQHLARLSGKLSSLESLIHEMQEKIQQPASELLQDFESILKQCEKKEETENSVILNPELTRRTKHIWDINHFLEADLKHFKANVTLDPDTTHPELILSEDWKTVRCGGKAQDLPTAPSSHKGSAHHSSRSSTKHTKSCHHSASRVSHSSNKSHKAALALELVKAKADAAIAVVGAEFAKKEKDLKIEAARLQAERDGREAMIEVLRKETEAEAMKAKVEILEDALRLMGQS